MASWDDEEEGTFEVVEELTFDEVVDEGPAAQVAADGFSQLVTALEAVARNTQGDGHAASTVRALLGRDRLDTQHLEADPASVEALVAGNLLVRTGSTLARSEAFAREVNAWRGVLQGESDDLSGCGAAGLDEWCANIVARAVGRPALASSMRRELRLQGVAAFGVTAGEGARVAY